MKKEVDSICRAKNLMERISVDHPVLLLGNDGIYIGTIIRNAKKGIYQITSHDGSSHMEVDQASFDENVFRFPEPLSARSLRRQQQQQKQQQQQQQRE